MCQKILISFLLILILTHSTYSLRCYFTDLIWPKECSHVIEEKYGARPACLWAIIIDGNEFKIIVNLIFYLIHLKI